MERVHPGPRNPDVLGLQQNHRSEAVWNGEQVRSLRSRSHILINERFRVSERVVEYLKNTQFYGAHRVSSMKLDVGLISALVERWRQETHTFHLPIGEATITLQDVQVLLGLRIGGEVVSGNTIGVFWPNVIQELLGILPPEGVLKGSSLKLSWLIENFTDLPNDANNDVLEHYVRAYLLILFGTILFPDKSGDDIQVIYLPLLEDLEEIDTYSWGSAVLATLYRNLCRATEKGKCEIGGCLTLLQLWSWERIAFGRPNIVGPRYLPHEEGVYPFGSQHQLRLDPFGCRWFRIDRELPEGSCSLQVYRNALDSMRGHHFTWQPYPDSIFIYLPDICRVDSEEWVVIAPLICFDIVEWHFPDRVVRQFGWKQLVPSSCDTETKLHNMDKRGSSRMDWKRYHNTHIKLWERRGDFKVSGTIDESVMDYYDPYMVWYRDHTRRFISPILPTDPSYGHMELLTQGMAHLYTEHNTMLNSLPAEVPSQYRDHLTNMRSYSYQCLEQVGYEHLIQPELRVQPTEEIRLDDHSPLIQYIERQRRSGVLSPVIEEENEGSSSANASHQSKRKKRT